MQKASSFDLKKWWKSVLDEGIRFPLYMMGKPFKAFSDIKYENKGSLPACITFLFILMLLSVLCQSYTGAIFTKIDPRYMNIWMTMAGVLIQTVLLCVANWSVSVLTNGSGSFKEIFMVAMYARYPYMWLRALYLVLSHVLSLEEAPLLNFCMSLAIIGIVFYGFIGLVSVHGYGFFQGIASVIFTVIALVIIIFVILMLVSMGSELVSFVQTVGREIVLHYF